MAHAYVRTVLRTLAFLLIAAPFGAFAESRLYVASYLYDDIRMYDGATGAYLGDFVPRTTAPIGTPLFIEFGPDRDLYVNNRRTTSILRFDGDTGDLVAEYRDDSILFAGGIDFGPNGNLFVAATLKDDETGVIEFDRLTGNSLGLFATATGTPVGIEFGPDGNLYAALAYPENAVERFDGATGATLGTFGTSHLDNPQSLTFGPNGNLFVHSQYNHNIVEYNALSGEFIRIFVDQEYPFNPSVGMEFGPDGNLYTTSLTAGAPNDGVHRYDGATGAFIDYFVPGDGQFWSTGLAFQPVPEPSTLAMLIIGTASVFARRRYLGRKQQTWRRIAARSGMETV